MAREPMRRTRRCIAAPSADETHDANSLGRGGLQSGDRCNPVHWRVAEAVPSADAQTMFPIEQDGHIAPAPFAVCPFRPANSSFDGSERRVHHVLELQPRRRLRYCRY
jgi:hypothetical protein